MDKKHLKRNNTAGFTLIEMLFSLAITLMIVFSITSVVKVITTKEQIPLINADVELGVKSLSQDLYIGKDFKVGRELEYYNNEDELCTISLHNQRIVRSPGFIIYAHNITELWFSKEQYKVYMHITKGEDSYTYWIASEYDE